MTSTIIRPLIASVVLWCAAANATYAQQDGFGWRVGGGVGYMGYHGDLSSNNLLKEITQQFKPTKDRDISWGVSVERKLGGGVGLCINYAQGNFEANDLLRDKDDAFYNRSLNARTELRDINGSLVFGRQGHGFLSPYLLVGGGLTDFKVYGNLRDADNNFYNYTTSNVSQDDTYETRLDNLKTESNDHYSTFVPHLNAGIGLRFRLSAWLSLHLQTDLRYAFSDHLDDVGNNNFRADADNLTQAYATRPNPLYTGTRANNTSDVKLFNNDLYNYTSLSLRVSFGRRRADFTPPIFYSSNNPQPVETIQVVPTEVPVGNTYVTLYDTLRQTSQNYQMQVDSSMAQQTRIILDSLQAVKLNNQQVQAEIAQSRADYALLQNDLANLKANQTEQERKAMADRIDELNNQVKYLSIATASNVKPVDSTSVDAKYLTELQKLRTELAAFKTEQADKERLAQMKAVDAANPQPAVSNNLPIATDASSLYYQRDMQAVREQLAALNNQQGKQLQQPVVVQQAAPATSNAAESQAMMNTMQALSIQLNSISDRLRALEGKPASVITTAPPTIITTPAPQSTNNAQNELLQQQIRDLQNQLNNINSKPAPAQQPVIINTSAPTPQQPNNNQELLNQIKALQDQVKDLSSKPAPQQQPIIVQTPAPQPVIVQQAAPKITYQQAIAPLRNTSIYFDVNSTVIKPAEVAKLEQMANVLRTYPEAKITISGYTDATGGDEYNRKLSERRANAVRDRLIQGYGIQATKVVLNAFGKSAAVGSAANALDRRVDIVWAD